MSDRKYCVGCRDDFYNGKNSVGVTECWLLKNAQVVTRYRIGWWTPPTSRDAFTKVETHDCHHAPGQYQDSAELPPHLAGGVADQGEAQT